MTLLALNRRAVKNPLGPTIICAAVMALSAASAVLAAFPMPQAPATIGQLIQHLDAQDAVAPVARTRKIASKGRAVRS